MSAHRVQLKDFIGRDAFGTVEKEYVHSALLRLFTKSFAHRYLSWASAKGSNEFTLKTSQVWVSLNDVINEKFPNFQKNMGDGACTLTISTRMSTGRRQVLEVADVVLRLQTLLKAVAKRGMNPRPVPHLSCLTC